jgi:hypothetical protein
MAREAAEGGDCTRRSCALATGLVACLPVLLPAAPVHATAARHAATEQTARGLCGGAEGGAADVMKA